MSNETRTLDRVVSFDEKSRAYPIMGLLGAVNEYKTQVWDLNVWNDQGQEGACVGFGWSHELAATPEVVPTNATVALEIYHRAQKLDEWPGESYSGTSVLAGAKAVKERVNNVGTPYMSEYRWAFGLSDLILALGYQGPAVLGVNWYNNMFDTDANGYVHPTGGVAGGHCILALGVVVVPKPGVTNPTALTDLDLDQSYIILHNSWGRDWGQNGRAKITLTEMQILLDNQGEACIPVVRTSDQSVVAPVVPGPDPAPVKPKNNKEYFAVARTYVFHGTHPGLRKARIFATYEDARKAGLRPCGICRPTP